MVAFDSMPWTARAVYAMLWIHPMLQPHRVVSLDGKDPAALVMALCQMPAYESEEAVEALQLGGWLTVSQQRMELRTGRQALVKAEDPAVGAERVLRRLNRATGIAETPQRNRWEWDQLIARVREYGEHDCLAVVEYAAGDAQRWQDGKLTVPDLFGSSSKTAAILMRARAAEGMLLSGQEHRTAAAASALLRSCK